MAQTYVKGVITVAIWAAVAGALVFSKAFEAHEPFSCYAAMVFAGAAAYATKQIWNPENAADLEAVELMSAAVRKGSR